ncbi:MAG: DUF6152 family protein [Rhodospirillaceae bacterium]|nr:DUF6152 family protein [Rhodospirillaceae bacterium]
MYRTLTTASFFLAALAAHGHHAYTEFDTGRIVEVEGTLVNANWRNPHAVLEVQLQDESDSPVIWEIEAPPVNHFRRNGVPLEIYEVGSTVKVAGWPSRRSDTRMYSTNILSEDGLESVLWLTETRWNEIAYGLGLEGPIESETQQTAADAPTLFRVWTSGYGRPGIPNDPDSGPGTLWRGPLPLTEAARSASASFDPVVQTSTDGCTPKGMPLIMGQPYPIEFVDRGEVIELRLEEYDTVRTIHMNGNGTAQEAPDVSHLGYSTGHWDGDTLVVETSHVRTDYMAPRGVPLGEGASFTERFTVGEEGSRLLYTVRITAPDVLTETIERSRSWIVTPGERVMPFECIDPYADQ